LIKIEREISMLVVKLSHARYEYDVNSLVKAFYPEKTVKVLTPETLPEKRMELEDQVKIDIQLSEWGAEVKIMDRIFSWKPDQETQADVALLEDEETEGQEEDVFYTKLYKAAFKRFFYRCLQDETGKSLPWGNLTGIRPTKIAMGLLEQGCSGQAVLDFMEQTHYVSPEKAKLALEIAERERQILSGVHYENGYSLYIGIPFCPTTCLYCSFTSYPVSAYRKKVDRYLDALIKEMHAVAEVYRGKVLDSVYIGGGTPTTLEAWQLDRLLEALKNTFDFSTVQEFTVEAGRADSITREKLEVLREYGVTRISINPQTMKQETLQLIGRRHTVEQVREAYALARDVGFENINMDIILGLPRESVKDVTNTIEDIIGMAPDRLTVHSLAVKRASKLGSWIQENGIEALQNTEETMEIAARGAGRMNLYPYYLYRQKNMSGNFENVGYAAEGKYGLYNILIMEEKQTIVALGAGSITKVVFPDGRIERCNNIKDVTLYIEKIDEMIEKKRTLLEEEE